MSVTRACSSVFRADAAPVPDDADLGRPGSATVSCLLMQDAVAADELSIKDGYGTVALFANPFRGGKEEALIVDTEGQLTYLERAGSETGWRQRPVLGENAEAIRATEVLVVVHPQDFTLWAIYNGGDGNIPRGLRLSSTDDKGNVLCTWTAVPHAVRSESGHGISGVRNMFVYYDGTKPHVTAIDVQDGSVLTLGARMNAAYRFGIWGLAANPGTLDQLVGGVVTSTSQFAHRPYYSVAYWRIGNKLVRCAANDGLPSRAIASDAREIVGVYRSYDMPDIGVVYLNTAGQLVSWNMAAGAPDGQYRYTEGLGVLTAKSWLDVNGLMHVYGIGPDTLPSGGKTTDRLKVLHQVSWDAGGVPVWSRSTNTPPLAGGAEHAHAEPTAAAPATVPTWVGLVPDVVSFALDPYPDYLPSQLVKLSGVASAADKYAVHTQDVTSIRWSRDKVRLAATGSPHLVNHYVSSVTLRDRRGNPMAWRPVQLSAETLVEIQVDGASYLVGPGHSVEVLTNGLGKVTIATPADGLLPATLHVDASGLENGAIVQPAAAVHEYLAGNSPLPSQDGLFSGEALLAAETSGKQPVVKPGTRLDGCNQVVASTGNVFRKAAGQPMKSALRTGAGPAPAIHGFAIGPDLSPAAAVGALAYHEFTSAEEAEAHRAAMRAHPRYQGIWDDFANWVGDVWEGIKNGVIEVAKVIVDTVTIVFIKIGEAFVELANMLIDTVETAVRAVEAVVSLVVTAVEKLVDWLTALFSFKDIWETKKALESGLHQMAAFASSTFSHYGGQLHGWFEKQEAATHGYFEAIKAQYLGQPVGNAANVLPAVTNNETKTVISPEELHSNPQGTWLLDQTVSPRMLATLTANANGGAIDPKIDAAWTTFLTRLGETDLSHEFQAVLGDLNILLSQITNPADPAAAAKASMVALIDILEQLIVAALKALDHVLQAAVGLLTGVADGLKAVLDLPLPLGPVNSLYSWLHQQSGVPDRDDLTLGGLISLIGAFLTTTAYKLVHGVKSSPFPGGRFPTLPAPMWSGRDANPEARAALFADPGFVKNMKLVKGVCGVMGMAGAFTNAAADVIPVLPASRAPGFGPAAFVGGSNAFLVASAGMMAACPPVSGKDWDNDHATGAFAFAAANALLSWTVVYLYLFDRVKVPALKNLGDVTLGPVIAVTLASGQLGFTASGGLPNDYAKAQAGLAAVPGLIQAVRFGAKDTASYGPARAWAVGGIDLLVGLTAGAMTAAAAFSDGPSIPSQQLPDGKVGQRYQARVARDGEAAYNTPWTWTVSGSLPPGLSMDPATGVVSGVPRMEGSTVFDLTCVDSYAPRQTAARTGFRITVRP
ncbi:Ig domain-containing protein [Pyxidicoccus xibeiensis]|uniref:Ig domain-containing protein n=1 Tax=Pyxidicoccus xibeiensis TaxID=2906759 RepID=UPI0020A78E8E|nr:Ig domain-containing protein [Pyxidicoccus xibeiensis]MCP3143850.1 Ig domain-containing protein [Pyxidicoccus xibeiensis]